MEYKTYIHVPSGKVYKVNGAGGLIPVDGSSNSALPLWLRDKSKDWVEGDTQTDNVLKPDGVTLTPVVTPAQVKQVYAFPHVQLAKVVNGQAQPEEIKRFILTELKLI